MAKNELSVATTGESHVETLKVVHELALGRLEVLSRRKDDDVLFTTLDRIHGVQIDMGVAGEVLQNPVLLPVEDNDCYGGRMDTVAE